MFGLAQRELIFTKPNPAYRKAEKEIKPSGGAAVLSGLLSTA
jgi:hypothetical protein